MTVLYQLFYINVYGLVNSSLRVFVENSFVSIVLVLPSVISY